MNWRWILVLTGAIAAAFVTGRAVPRSESVAAAQPGAEAGQPAPPVESDLSKHLGTMLGDWDAAVKVWMGPDTDPFESTATVRREWTLDGRFLLEHVEMAAPGMPALRGIGFVGYNAVEKRYENVWLESNATHITFMTGRYDEAARTLTLEGDLLDPMSGTRSRQRHVIDLSDADRHIATGYGISADGKAQRNFEGTFTRRK